MNLYAEIEAAEEELHHWQELLERASKPPRESTQDDRCHGRGRANATRRIQVAQEKIARLKALETNVMKKFNQATELESQAIQELYDLGIAEEVA